MANEQETNQPNPQPHLQKKLIEFDCALVFDRALRLPNEKETNVITLKLQGFNDIQALAMVIQIVSQLDHDPVEIHLQRVRGKIIVPAFNGLQGGAA